MATWNLAVSWESLVFRMGNLIQSFALVLDKLLVAEHAGGVGARHFRWDIRSCLGRFFNNQKGTRCTFIRLLVMKKQEMPSGEDSLPLYAYHSHSPSEYPTSQKRRH